jgi:hypothetical protein
MGYAEAMLSTIAAATASQLHTSEGTIQWRPGAHQAAALLRLHSCTPNTSAHGPSPVAADWNVQ